MTQACFPTILSADEPPPAAIVNQQGGSPFLLLCDHACNSLPHSLGDLGLPPGEIERHIGWDIGALGVSTHLSEYLDATLVHQRYSRLVIDCNRSPAVESSIPQISELTPVPGNMHLDPMDSLARQQTFFFPYHQAIEQVIDGRLARQQPTIVIAMHSFTPVYKGIPRKWQIGLLYNRQPVFAELLARVLHDEGNLLVGLNEPYIMTDDTDYTLPVHAEQRGLPYVGIEIRQDLIGDVYGQQAWAERLARLLPVASRHLGI
ncbi:N-formylglutamate amidohydrolase [Serratia sp. AKBS12]|uniref:N-formylglutamate amidohydrolase n=1 Tax=Serratia sp. AKBS12 TaxID=2974597 RepID=UPI002165F4BE|nr:N-formylglutamate amidohydrolase [Serratia sp. AKBS12]MCS3408619.1 N-formylglutamate amidohydrolase [Serratia sp. AKBS12]HEI8864956.1 N-formylglutamate amidohydrolase [Serratia odorifera]